MRVLRSVAVAGFVLAAACGGGTEAVVTPPPPVPTEIVPSVLDAGKLKILENVDKKTQEAFTGGGKKILIGDGKLWEIRDGQRLIGTLQLSTLKTKVDVTKKDTRDTIVRGLMPGSVNRLDVDDVTVFATSSNDKITYLWFGKRLFQVVTLKGTALEPEKLLGELIAYQLGTPKGQDVLLRGDLEEEDEEEA